MKKFNTEQLTAIEHTDGPALVLAGPGSGKTTVITNRIASLVAVERINPESILAVTFTRAAADEMKLRYEALIKGMGICEADSHVTFGTFHSIFLGILKQYLRDFSIRLADQAECSRLIKAVFRKLYPDMRPTSDYFGALLSAVSRLKNGLHHNDAKHNEYLAGIAAEYERALREAGLIDYDDMLLLCLRLIKKDSRVLSELQKRFRYITVDEFQDINMLQFEIVRLIAGRRQNIFAVGDDDQSIYGFRGSEPSVMLSFSSYFNDPSLIFLNTNYRSDEKIVRAALSLISHNKNRYKKKLKAVKSGGKDIDIRSFDGEEETAAFIIRRLENMDADCSAAILFRTHRAGSLTAGLIVKSGITVWKNISLMSFHASKGLEFDVVYIIGAIEHITPGNVRSRDELEEERRMFYVAMTRARSELHIFYTKSFYNTQSKKTRFINEIR